MTRPVVSTGILAIVMLAAWLALSGGAFPDVPTSTAVQAPRMSLDMQPAGNSYSDSTNTMTVGAVDNCLTSDTGNGAQHNHVAHLIIQDVEDLVGWQARMNYDGARMRPSTVNFTPFTDNTTGQNVSFLNLPLDAGVHRDLVTATDIPPQSAALQTALIGAVYNGEQTVAVSPDTPAKLLPDDNSYSTSGGGVLAAVNVQVLSGQVGAQSLALDLDDILPNSPGSSITVFVGDGTTTTDLTEVQLGDGYHGEGAPCLPIPTAPPLPTPPPQREIVSLLPSDVVLPAVVLPDADLDGTADPLDLCPATQSGSAVNANGCSQLQDDPTGAPAALGRGFEDRPDDTTGYQVHYVYLVPIDRFDQSRDTSGFIERSTNAQNAWLRAKTRGQNRAWRVDTSGGSPDITFIQPPKTDQQFRDENCTQNEPPPCVLLNISRELTARGFNKFNKRYFVYYEGSHSSCGSAYTSGQYGWGQYGAIYFGSPGGCNSHSSVDEFGNPHWVELTALHETTHNDNIVALGSPNRCSGTAHACDDGIDLMWPNAHDFPANLDEVLTGDYWRHNRTTGDISTSPFLEPSLPVMDVNDPSGGTPTLKQPFSIRGWALDWSAPVSGFATQNTTGVDAVGAWAYPSDASGTPVGSERFLGYATLGGDRQDVANAYGPQFRFSGYNLSVTGLAAGYHLLRVQTHSSVSGTWNNEFRRVIQIPGREIFIDDPAAGPPGQPPQVTEPFLVRGWAADFAAATGTGVDAVYLYGTPSDANGTPTGPTLPAVVATYGRDRPDVAAQKGAQYQFSGYDYNVNHLPDGFHRLEAYAHSYITNTWYGTPPLVVNVVDLDDDNDGWSDTIEGIIGTDPRDACANTIAENDEADDRWPADFDDDRISDTADIAQVTGRFGKTVQPAGTTASRYDIAPDPPNPNPNLRVVDTADIARLTGLFGRRCT